MNKRLRKRAGQRSRRRPINDVTARGLGWFSIGLGVAEISMPRAVARAVGIPGASGLVFLYGLREVATGLGILRTKNSTPWLWGRVAGDALDLATLATLSPSNRKLSAGLGMAAVAGVTALDFTMARAMSERDQRRSRSWVDYSDRSGFPTSPDEIRGQARRDFQTPRDMAIGTTTSEKELSLS